MLLHLFPLGTVLNAPVHSFSASLYMHLSHGFAGRLLRRLDLVIDADDVRCGGRFMLRLLLTKIVDQQLVLLNGVVEIVDRQLVELLLGGVLLQLGLLVLLLLVDNLLRL